MCLLAGATTLVLLAILMLPADQPQSLSLVGARPLRTEAAPQVRVAPDALLGWQSRLLGADRFEYFCIGTELWNQPSSDTKRIRF